MMLTRSTGGTPANPVMAFTKLSFLTLMASSKEVRKPPMASGTATVSSVPGMASKSV